jgi:hypothetical protein
VYFKICEEKPYIVFLEVVEGDWIYNFHVQHLVNFYTKIWWKINSNRAPVNWNRAHRPRCPFPMRARTPRPGSPPLGAARRRVPVVRTRAPRIASPTVASPPYARPPRERTTTASLPSRRRHPWPRAGLLKTLLSPLRAPSRASPCHCCRRQELVHPLALAAGRQLS